MQGAVTNLWHIVLYGKNFSAGFLPVIGLCWVCNFLGLCWQGAAPEGVTVERTLEFIREESKVKLIFIMKTLPDDSPRIIY